ncbi:trypsin-like serine peptidase [Sorangium sp. So ce854]|uniref:trypsin-like serine peptidase n=1 Tax=Sorangium sp. So ce854 TaxID=3133322 RepID=UPI003F5DB500
MKRNARSRQTTRHVDANRSGLYGLIFALPCTFVACVEGAPCGVARSPAIIGELAIEPLAPSEAALLPVASAMGLLAVRIPGPKGEAVLVPCCSGFRISRRHVLTAAHCEQAGLVFNLKHIARTGDVAKVRTTGFGSMVRLVFEGETILQPEEGNSLPSLGAPLYANEYLDVAVFGVEGVPFPAGTFIDLRGPAARDVRDTWNESLNLYAYPNGLPLARSFDCRGAQPISPDVLYHDCDSLPGSSGGLLVSQSTGAAVAIHVAASGENDYRYLQQTGHFESVAELGARSGGAGYNRAITLAAVAKAIEREAASLWREILEASRTPTPPG